MFAGQLTLLPQTLHLYVNPRYTHSHIPTTGVHFCS